MGTQQPPEDNAPHPADRQAPTAKPVSLMQPAAAVPIAIGETSSSAIAAREKAAVEARFLMALHRPREFETVRLRLLRACERPLFAEIARYSKPIGTEKVHGLSIRFAEEARVLWGNMEVMSMVVSDTDDRRIYRVTSIDFETNAGDSVDIIIEKFVERKHPQKGAEVIGQRLNSKGELVHRIRATEDDLIVKVNNQIAKARRNVILSLIPGDVKEECENQCILTMQTRDKEDPEGAKRKILDSFFRMGVLPTQLAELLGHSVEALNPAELVLLRGYYTALKEEGTTWTEIMEAHGKKADDAGNGNGAATPTKGVDGLKSRLDARGKKGGEEPGAGGAATAPVAGTAGASTGAGVPTQADLLAEDRQMLASEQGKKK